MEQTAQESKHCVRCHGTYTEDGNTNKSCAIPHVFSSDTYLSGYSRGSKIYAYDALCCKGVQVEEEGAGNGMYRMGRLRLCSTAMHTDDPEEAADDHNDLNIVPCEFDTSGKCKTRYLDPNAREPHFLW